VQIGGFADVGLAGTADSAYVKGASSKTVLAVIAAAAALTAAAIGLSVGRSDAGGQSSASALSRASASFSDLPQDGVALGSPRAPVTLVEFADLQCPYCAHFARDALPAIVRDYVRPGRVRIVFQGLSFVGPDSVKALHAVLAAALQNRGWNVLDELYRRQGPENSGWVTDALLRQVAGRIPGLSFARMIGQSESPTVEAQLRLAARAARDAGVRGTPSFLVGPTGGPFHSVALSSLSAEALRPALDAALAR
jgi:protein-disulfide isomerase